MNLLDLLSGNPFTPPPGRTRLITMETRPNNVMARAQNTKEEIAKTRGQIIHLLKCGYCTVPLLETQMSVHFQTIRKALNRLIEEGLVQRRGGSPVIYTLTEKFYAGA